jgi:predicted metal-dependent hydrolase
VSKTLKGKSALKAIY